MWRRAVGVIVTLTLGLLVAPLATEAQQAKEIRRIGYLTSVASSADSTRSAAFRQGLHELGYVEGQNITIAYRYAVGELDRLPSLAEELVGLPVEVLVVSSTPAVLAAKHATTTIPIIMTNVGDPVGEGLVVSLARPGGNITGLTALARDLSGKRLELLKETIPGLPRVGVLWDPRSQGAARFFQETEAAAWALGVQLQALEVQSPEEVGGRSQPPRKDEPAPSSCCRVPSPRRTADESWNLQRSIDCQRCLGKGHTWKPGVSCPTRRVTRSCSGVRPCTWTKSSQVRSLPTCPSSSRRRSSW